MTTILTSLIMFFVTIGILITVHELGHFFAARYFGVEVEQFSLGFGKSLIKWRNKKHKTEFSINLILLGGYVKMKDTADINGNEVSEQQKEGCFNQKPLWQRFIIVAAGPLVNFALAIFIYWCSFLVGERTTVPVINQVEKNSIAADAGLAPHMKIIRIDNQPVLNWNDVWRHIFIKIKKNKSIEFEVSKEIDANEGVKKKLLFSAQENIDLDKINLLQYIGIIPNTSIDYTSVFTVQENSAAQKAGLQPGDQIIAINKKLVTNWYEIRQIIRDNPNKTLNLDVRRNSDKEISMILVPHKKTLKEGNETKIIGIAGIEFNKISLPFSDDHVGLIRYNPLQALSLSISKTADMIHFIGIVLKKIVIGDLNLKNISGPIAISEFATKSFEDGFMQYFSFLALLSINLGVMNLLPLPILDGGRLLFFVIEAIKGSPISLKVQTLSYKFGFITMLGFMLLALFNDFSRLMN